MIGDDGGSGPVAEAGEAAVVVVASAPERNRQAVGDVAQGEIFEADQLEGRALAIGQMSKAGRDQPAALLARELPGTAVRAGVEGEHAVGARGQSPQMFGSVQGLAVVGHTPPKGRFAPEGPVVGVLEQPYLDAAPCGVELMGLAVDLEEDLLRDVFRFGGVTQNVGRDSIDEPRVALDEGLESVAVGGEHAGDELQIRRPGSALDLHRWYLLSTDVRYNYAHDWWFTNPRGCGTQPRVPRRKASSQKSRPRPAVLRPLGAQLRRLRLDRRWSQEYLAERAGLNYKYVGRIELGKADPGADVLVRLARALTVPVGELFETITPSETAPYRLSPSDIESVSAALNALQATVERVLARQPRPTPARAPRSRR